jgi:iron(III) transport system ATP-binding protein
MIKKPHSTMLHIDKLDVCYGAETVLKDINITLEKGDITCILGPSGSGKTSLLRSIAGFIEPSGGSIDINGKRVSDAKHVLTPNKRSVGVVFQDFALFPHLTVQQNIEFGLGQLHAKEKQATAHKYMDIMGIVALANKYPADLSGGQQQRVAIARAVAPQPSILLMDEAFSSLDPTLREQVAKDVRGIIQQLGLTAVLVTHDQQEAFAFADKIAVLANQRLQQFSSAYDLYHEPASYFVANFIGEGAFIKGDTVLRDKGWFANTALGEMRWSDEDYANTPKVKVLLRPDDVLHDDVSPIKATVLEKHFRGAFIRYELALPLSGEKVLCFAPSHHNHNIGESFGIRAEVEHVICF